MKPSPPVPPRDKILSRDELVHRFGRPRCERVVFTNGCFDLLHRGHVEYLFAARALGDRLVVGLNSDPSVRRLKGAERPVNGEDDRAMVLAGLAAVDAVTVFDEDTPLSLVEALLPDVLVKGGDYRFEEIVGAPEVVAAGGEVVIAPLVPGRSTTSILQRVQKGDPDAA
jgi:rfaE bifunctional protein nucleotidyltransferase chain/domain